MEKVRYNGKDIYIDDTPVDYKDTGVIIRSYDCDEALDKTVEIKDMKNILENNRGNDHE